LISRSLIIDIIKRSFLDIIKAIFSSNPIEWYYSIPFINRISVNKTKFWQLGTIRENKGSIEGIYKVYDKIFLDNLKIRVPAIPREGEDDFIKRL
jgi:hypothetical protein